jgi:uncharacterized protein with PhoU and TrkA domain
MVWYSENVRLEGMDVERQLKMLTEQLLDYNQKILAISRQAHEQKREPDFFAEVKPFADQVKQVLDEWKEIALLWVRKTRPKHIHELQIETVGENIEKISVEAFYPSVSERRIKQFCRSVEYTLSLVLESLEQKRHNGQ